MNIWLISTFEPLPIDNTRPMRFSGIADMLVGNGHKVTFWSSTYNHFTKSQRYFSDQTIKIKPDYTLKLVYARPYKKNISINRLVSHGNFAKHIARQVWREKKPDLIYLAFPPIRLVQKIAEYAASNKIPVVLDIIDPWPDVFLNILPDILKKPSKLLLSGYYNILKKAFASSNAIFSISETYIKWARKFVNHSGVHFEVFYPAVDTSLYRFKLKNNGNIGPLRFIYAGTLGASYDIRTIIKVAEIFSEKEAEFIIAGDGPDRKELEKMATGLPHVKFAGWLNGDDLRKELINADIGIAAYKKKGTQTVTYKLFDYLSAGLPIISSLDGEMRSIIDKNGLGEYYEAENVSDLESSIRKFLSMSSTELNNRKSDARRFAVENGDSQKIYGKLVDTLENLIL